MEHLIHEICDLAMKIVDAEVRLERFDGILYITFARWDGEHYHYLGDECWSRLRLVTEENLKKLIELIKEIKE